MANDLELRLIDAPAPDGEIVIKDLAALTSALQELTTRIGRDVVNTPGPGQTKQFMEEFAQLRLRGIESGSTILSFSKGPTDKLDIDLPQQKLADDRFWELINSIREDRRPDWASDLIAESAARFVGALQAAAPRAVLRDSAHTGVEIESRSVHVETWTSNRVQTDTVMTAMGRLEKVDLRSRVRDDVGQAVDLKHVAGDNAAAHLVGQWVIAQGEGVLFSGRLVALDNASIEPLDDPASVLVGDTHTTIEEILASAPGPNPDGGVELTDQEFTAFLEAARA